MPFGGRLAQDQVANGLSRPTQLSLACEPFAPSCLEVFAVLGKAVETELTRIAANSSRAAVLVKVAKRLFVVSQARLAQTFGAIAFESH
jgi:hypothetical protein